MLQGWLKKAVHKVLGRFPKTLLQIAFNKGSEATFAPSADAESAREHGTGSPIPVLLRLLLAGVHPSLALLKDELVTSLRDPFVLRSFHHGERDAHSLNATPDARRDMPQRVTRRV